MFKKKWFLYCLISIIIVTIIYFIYYKRTIIHDDNETLNLTIWKQLGGKCFIIPGKYYSIFKPKDNYIETGNKAILNIAWNPEIEHKKYALTISLSDAKTHNLTEEVLFYEDYNAFIEKFYGKKFDTLTRRFNKSDSVIYYQNKYETSRINIGCLYTNLCKDE